MRQRKWWASSSSVGLPKLETCSHFGFVPRKPFLTAPSLPEVSIPCRTSSSRARSWSAVDCAHSRSCKSPSSEPISSREASTFLRDFAPGVERVSIALRSTGPLTASSSRIDAIRGGYLPSGLPYSKVTSAYDRVNESRGRLSLPVEPPVWKLVSRTSLKVSLTAEVVSTASSKWVPLATARAIAAEASPEIIVTLSSPYLGRFSSPCPTPVPVPRLT